MQDEILAMLTTKFQGVSESVLGRIAAKLARTATTTEQARTAVDGTTMQQVIDSYADSRVTEATATAVKNYEVKHGLKDGKPVQPQEVQGGTSKSNQPDRNNRPNGEGVDATPAWAKQILEANKALQDRLDKLEGERTNNDRKQQLHTAIKGLPEAFRKPYDRIDLAQMTDEQFRTFIGEVTTEADGLTKQINTRGAVFGRPVHSGKSTGTELTKEQVAAINQRSGAVSKDAQPF